METIENYTNLIKGGESQNVEFKAGFFNEQNIATSLIALANSEGGYLFIGITNEGRIIGITADALPKQIKKSQALCDSIFPYPIEISDFEINGRHVICIHVTKAPSHFGPITASTGDVFVRYGDKNVRVSNDYITISAPEVQKTSSAKKLIGFVAMSFREEEEPALVDYYRAMLRAVAQTNLPMQLIRMDLREGDYEISQQIIE
ncbi:helix-turn-helix domain-containing protein [Hymenobacter monticola]|uniref:ATP-binding protein n=1 Tax=Hymenobacter monticola TaxID=1705399 RepID=A0ABY4B0H2_9BACT|nr:ATP-binding protein [Hymenobacter monticola]UOE32662.1 ATP-binding protein [Hymenobacter monticola]